MTWRIEGGGVIPFIGLEQLSEHHLSREAATALILNELAEDGAQQEEVTTEEPQEDEAVEEQDE